MAHYDNLGKTSHTPNIHGTERNVTLDRVTIGSTTHNDQLPVILKSGGG